MAGRFISFEGGEGAGKSTQARMLAEWLENLGLDVVLTREPGGTPEAEAIRALLLQGEGERWTAEAEALLFAAARADHVARLIRPALERGAWVISDRFLDSSRAYQSGASGLADSDVLTLHRFGSGGLLPDRTIFLTLTPETSAARTLARDGDASDRIGGRDASYHARVNAAFENYATMEPDRFRQVSGEGALQDVQTDVRAAIADLLPE